MPPKSKNKNKPGGKSAAASKNTAKFLPAAGFIDILPHLEPYWREVERIGHGTADIHDFHFFEPAAAEPASLYESKFIAEAISGLDRRVIKVSLNRSKAVLRFNWAVAAIRSYAANRLGHFAMPFKGYTNAPIFGNFDSGARQKFGWFFAVLGESDSLYDAEIIFAIIDFLESLKIKNFVVEVNSAGCKVCRNTYARKIKAYYKQHLKQVCSDCRECYEKSPAFLTHCLAEKCQKVKKDAPLIFNYLCQNCNTHFQEFLSHLEDNGVNYQPNPHFFGDDNYYSKVVFRVKYLGQKERLLAGGGRFDYLGEKLGGRQLPGVGGWLDTLELIAAVKEFRSKPKKINPNQKQVYFIAVGDKARLSSSVLINKIRKSGIKVLESVGRKAFKPQLKMAEKNKVKVVVIYGQREVFDRSIIIRDTETNFQENVPIEKMVDHIKKMLK